MSNLSALHTALTSFVEQQDRYNEAYGLFTDTYIRAFSEPVQPHVDERLTLSPELQYLYSHYEMVDEAAAGTLKRKSAAVLIGHGILLSFVAPEHLHRQQYGYRWIIHPETDETEESATWPASHLVIANYNDDPIIVDTAAPLSPVHASFEGGQAEPIADSLADFFQAMTIMVEGAFSFEGEITDEDTYEVKDSYIDLIQPQLQDLLGELYTQNLLVYLSLLDEATSFN